MEVRPSSSPSPIPGLWGVPSGWEPPHPYHRVPGPLETQAFPALQPPTPSPPPPIPPAWIPVSILLSPPILLLPERIFSHLGKALSSGPHPLPCALSFSSRPYQFMPSAGPCSPDLAPSGGRRPQMRLMASSPSMQSPKSRATRAGWRARAGFSKASPASVRGLPCRLGVRQRAEVTAVVSPICRQKGHFPYVSPRGKEGTQSHHLGCLGEGERKF